MGGEGYDGDVRPGFVGGADLASGLDAIHEGHLDVHEDEVVVKGLECGDDFFAVCDGVGLEADFLEHG